MHTRARSKIFGLRTKPDSLLPRLRFNVSSYKITARHGSIDYHVLFPIQCIKTLQRRSYEPTREWYQRRFSLEVLV